MKKGTKREKSAKTRGHQCSHAPLIKRKLLSQNALKRRIRQGTMGFDPSEAVRRLHPCDGTESKPRKKSHKGGEGG